MAAFLDTSIIIRYLTGDSPDLSPASRMIVERGEELILTDVAIAEAAWVLESVYETPRVVVVDELVALLLRENIDTFIMDKGDVIDAILLCRRSRRVSFPDALIWAAARSAGSGTTVYSFDGRFPADGIEVRATAADSR